MHFKYADYIVGGGVIIWTCWCAACKMQSETTHGWVFPHLQWRHPPISSADNWQFIHIIWSTSPHYSSGKSPLLFVIFTCSLSWSFTQAEHFLNLKPLTANQWLVIHFLIDEFSRNMKLCEKLAYTGCVWGTHDPVVGVAFIVVTIMCGVWHYVSNYFGIVLVFFWYHVWHYVWYYRNFQGICFSFIRHPKPLFVKVWNNHPAKHGSNCVKIFLIWSWWLIDCAHQVSGRSLKAFLVKRIPWKYPESI